MLLIYQLFLAILLNNSIVSESGTNELSVEIEGIRNMKGNVIVALFNNEDQFLRKDYRSIEIDLDANESPVVKFQNLPQGVYAISVIHDINKNGILDTNIFGIPVEDFGFSNNKMGTFGPPTFDECSLHLVEGNYQTTIILKKLM